MTPAAGQTRSDGQPLFAIDRLHVSFGDTPAVRGVSLHLGAGECVAIVGESGSGKSVTARALLGLAGPGSTVRADRLEIMGREMGAAKDTEWRRIRGRDIGLVMQDALVSLDPLRPISREIGDAIRLHERVSAAAAHARVLELLDRVGMPDPARAAAQRSGELSGGLRQRALIAAALALNPPILIADEPTTALDVSIQARILGVLAEITAQGTGVLLISHDLAVVSSIADRVLVMRDGLIVEHGSTDAVLATPTQEYTRALISAVPSDKPRGTPLSLNDRALSVRAVAEAATGDAAPAGSLGDSPSGPLLIEASGLHKSFRVPGGRLPAVDGVSLSVRRGETLGIVGESGSGKTTVARILLGLERADAGTVTLDGEAWSSLTERARRPLRRRIGAIYQDSLSSFDPRWSVTRILTDAAGTASAVPTLLEQVGLSPELAPRLPLTLSGGQRQRISIARALAAAPDILICDEPVSALDVTVQAQVLDLLNRLQRERGIAYVFISHDLGVVRHMSDRVAVMQDGRVVEHGDTEAIFASPQHSFTQRLVTDAPRLGLVQ